jgi:hypothetical protein
MNRSVSILGTVVVIMVTLLATVAVAFAAPDTEGGRGQTNGGDDPRDDDPRDDDPRDDDPRDDGT